MTTGVNHVRNNMAIIMTILVLELKKPNPISWENLWQLRMNFFAYTISFFWLGA
ncbi:DUF1211 domain-containing protein, partial [Streptococcus mutans]|nr:DUF1211 domain-containing protein [Streptococcus mutans]